VSEDEPKLPLGEVTLKSQDRPAEPDWGVGEVSESDARARSEIETTLDANGFSQDEGRR